MSTPPTPTPSESAPPLGQSLRRTSRNRILLGLLGGVARSMNISATLLRVIVLLASMVMLPLAAITYIVAAAIVPRDDGSVILGDGPSDSRDVAIAVVAALFAAPLAFGAGGHFLVGPFFGWPIVLVATGALIAVVVTALMRGDEPDPWQSPAPAPAPAGATGDTAVQPTAPAPPATEPGPDEATFVQPGTDETATFVQPSARAADGTSRKRGGLAAPIFAALLLIPAFFVLMLVTGITDPSWTGWAVMLAVMAVLAAVSAVGAAILRPSYLGPGLLILFAATAGISAIGVHAVGPLANDGVGARTYRPVSTDELQDGFRLGIGEMRIDLRDLDLPPRSTTTVNAELGIGELRVIVPRNVRVVAAPDSSLMHLGDLTDAPARTIGGRTGGRVIELSVNTTAGEIIVLAPDRDGDLRQIANETAGFWSRGGSNR